MMATWNKIQAFQEKLPQREAVKMLFDAKWRESVQVFIWFCFGWHTEWWLSYVVWWFFILAMLSFCHGRVSTPCWNDCRSYFLQILMLDELPRVVLLYLCFLPMCLTPWEALCRRKSGIGSNCMVWNTVYNFFLVVCCLMTLWCKLESQSTNLSDASTCHSSLLPIS